MTDLRTPDSRSSGSVQLLSEILRLEEPRQIGGTALVDGLGKVLPRRRSDEVVNHAEDTHRLTANRDFGRVTAELSDVFECPLHGHALIGHRLRSSFSVRALRPGVETKSVQAVVVGHHDRVVPSRERRTIVHRTS